MSEFLKKAARFLSIPAKKKEIQKEQTGSVQETGQEQRTGDAETEKREEKEKTEMKLKDRGKLFVGGLNHATTTKGLKDYFSCFGNVVDAVVVTFPDTKRSRGYGFVTFADPASAEVALAVESHVIDGKAVDIRLFESKYRKKKYPRLFLGGIPLDMKEEDLKNFFSRYGKITELSIPHSKSTNKPKGFAFLSFEEKEAAEKCLSESFVYLGNKRVLIKKATAKNESADGMSDAGDEVECFGSDEETATEYGDDALSLPDDDGQSSASGDKTSLFEQFPGFQSIFENYFQPKIALCDPSDPMENREGEQKWRPPVKDAQEMEKLLLSLFRESSTACDDTYPYEDLTDDDDDDDDDDNDDEDSGDGEESVSDEDEETEDYDYGVDEDDSDDDDRLFEKGSAVDDLSEKLKEILKGKIAEEKIGNLKSSVHENEVQSSSPPFIIKDKAGSLRCSLCQWTPPDGSCETFLAHCNTPEHRMKTRERFVLDDIQQAKPKNKSTDLAQEFLRMVSSETPLNRIQQGLSEKQNKVQIGQDSKERLKKKLPLPAEQIPQKQLNQQVPQQQKKKKTQQQPDQQKQQPQPQKQPDQQKQQPQPQKQPDQQQQKKKKTQQQPGQQPQPQQQKKKKTQQQPDQQKQQPQPQKQPDQQPQPQQQKKKKTQQQPDQQPQKQKKKKTQQQPGQQTPQQLQQKIQKKNQNSENKSENSKIQVRNKIPQPELNLKVHALAKGMVCIQPVSANELNCRMCNKMIPKAPDFATLMKNVSSHLQSKGHLNKLADTESSLRTALDKKPEEPVRDQKNVSGKNTTTGKKEQAPAQKVMPKGKNPGTGNNCEKTEKKIPKVAPATAAAAEAAPKVNFLCLSCNYFANKQETFNAHLKSKVHSESVNKNNLKPTNFVLCKGCNRYLCGSLYDINKHHNKCSK